MLSWMHAYLRFVLVWVNGGGPCIWVVGVVGTLVGVGNAALGRIAGLPWAVRWRLFFEIVRRGADAKRCWRGVLGFDWFF